MRFILAGLLLLSIGFASFYVVRTFDQIPVEQPAPLAGAQPASPNPALPSAPVAALPAPVVPPTAEKLAAARARLEKTLADAPEFLPFYAQFKSAYTSDYERFINSEVLNFISVAPTDDQVLLDAVDVLRKSRGLLAAKASSDAVTRIFDVQARVLGELAVQDPRLCDHFLFGGDAPAFSDFAKRNRALIADMAMAGLAAIVDGGATPVQRVAPTDADFAALEASLVQAGLNNVEISALLDGQIPPQPLEDTRICSIGQTYYTAMAALPAEAKFSIYALALESMAQ